MLVETADHGKDNKTISGSYTHVAVTSGIHSRLRP